MKKLLPVVLVICSLVITGSVGAYFLYILPQIETNKTENSTPKAKEEIVPIAEEIEVKTQSVDAKKIEAKQPTQAVVNNSPENNTTSPVGEASTKDPILTIEKCKVNSDQTAKEFASEAKKNYLSQKINSGVCSFPESQTTIEARATINRIINQYKVELNAALTSKNNHVQELNTANQNGDTSLARAIQGQISTDEYNITKAKTDLLRAETSLNQLETSLQAQSTDCLNGITTDSENFYKEIYQQKYDTIYSQCINE